MKELLIQFASYNTWANQKLIECIQSLPEEALVKELPSSFSSLQATLLHMWDAESIWWQRVKLAERVNFPSENSSADIRDVVNGLMNQSRQWEEWVNAASELSLDHVFQYQNTRREMFKQPVYQIIHHVFNHGTYHRGQLVNMLRQLGIEKIPSTDFTVFIRSRK